MHITDNQTILKNGGVNLFIVTEYHLILPQGTSIRNVIESANDKIYEWTENRYQSSKYNNWIAIWKHKSNSENKYMQSTDPITYQALGNVIIQTEKHKALDNFKKGGKFYEYHFNTAFIRNISRCAKSQ